MSQKNIYTPANIRRQLAAAGNTLVSKEATNFLGDIAQEIANDLVRGAAASLFADGGISTLYANHVECATQMPNFGTRQYFG